MKFIRKITAILTACIMAVSCLAVCGSADSDKTITIGQSYTEKLSENQKFHFFFTTDKAGVLTIKLSYTGNYLCGVLVGQNESGGTEIVKPDSVNGSTGKAALLEVDSNTGFVSLNEDGNTCACTVKYTVKKGMYLLTVSNESQDAKYRTSGKVTVKTSLGTKTATLETLTVTVKKGSALQLGALLSDGTSGSAKWSSSKKSVATVNSKGKVTAKAKGKAVITAKYGDSSMKITIIVE